MVKTKKNGKEDPNPRTDGESDPPPVVDDPVPLEPPKPAPPGPQPDKKEDPKDDPKPTLDPAHSLGSLLMLLKNLSEIVTKGSTVRMSDTVYGITNVPIAEFKVKVEPSIPQAFDTFEVGDERIPYMLYKPLCSAKFDSLDTLIDFMVSTFEIILDNI